MMELSFAQGVAATVLAHLRPYCEDILLVGSVRRGRAHVSDIEVVCRPKRVEGQGDFFSSSRPPEVSPDFVAAVNCWPKVRGEPTGKYTRRLVAPVTRGGARPTGEPCPLDIFMCEADNWGLQVVLRTGSAAWAHQRLAIRSRELHYEMREGFLWDAKGNRVPVRTEEQLFHLLKMPPPPPSERESPRVRNAKFRAVPAAGQMIWKCPLCGRERTFQRGPFDPAGADRAWRSCLYHEQAPEALTECEWVDAGGRALEL